LVASRGLNKRDAAALDQIAAIATRMESRMDAVERILDADSPTWRNGQSARRQAG
jgi:phage shock protein B